MSRQDRPSDGITGGTGDYLWDGAGTPDPLVAALERTLAPLAHRGSPPALGAPARAGRPVAWAAAAALLLAGVVGYYALRPAPPPRGPVTWRVDATDGAVKLARPDRDALGETGRWIETDSKGSATLRAEAGATLTLMADSRARAVDLGDSAQRIQLDRGGLYTAPSGGALPIEVDTPAGRLVIRADTSCLVQLGGESLGRIEVKIGRVETTRDGRLTRLPGGCVATLWRGGIGTPRRTGATAIEGLLSKLDDALARGVPVGERAELLRATLKSCGWDDHVTLWNLMQRVDPGERPAVLAAAKARTKSWLKSPDASLIGLEPGAMDEWWKMAVGE